MRRLTTGLWVGVLALAGCAATPPAALDSIALPSLPEPVTNNAVAALEGPDGVTLFSLLGLGQGKTFADTRSTAFRLGTGERHWQRLPDVPGDAGRLAATAAVASDRLYVFGGYTVAEDGTESSVETVHRFDATSMDWYAVPAMPVPVDDAVSLVYRDRYIYLVSGWHDSGNVNLVQLFDTQTETWSQATPWPGAAVFGSAGGIHNDTMVVCDGVSVRTHLDRRRDFGAEATCFSGTIDAQSPRKIDWRQLPHHSGVSLYRMAATGSVYLGGAIVFAGGADNPYNYDGLGYDGRPAVASDRVFAWLLDAGRWVELGRLAAASMDHRGLLHVGDRFVLVGGMDAARGVTESVTGFKLP